MFRNNFNNLTKSNDKHKTFLLVGGWGPKTLSIEATL